MDTVTEIKNRADIVELISQYTPLSRSGKTLKGLCPFHSEKHGSFFVYPDNQTWHCFGACATGGDIFSFIMKKEGLTFGEALERLAEKYGIPLPSRHQPTPEHDRLDDLFRLNAAAAQYFHDQLLTSPAAEKARAYLEKRGVSAGSIADFQLGYAMPEWQALKDHLNQAGYADDMLLEAGLLGRADTGRTYDRFRDQVIIPITDIRGRITGFGARVLNDSQPKYLNSPETPLFSKSATLFGINLAASAIRQADTAIIVEGYLDVIISHQYGFKNTVASMGTAITEKQIGILKKLSRRLVLALDADVAGEEAMTRCVPFENQLESEIRVAVAPAGQDPDDVIRHNPADWTNLIASAGPLVDFVFNHAAIGFDLRTAAGKSGLAEKLLPVVAGIKDPVRRGHYLAELAGRVGATTADLQYSLNRLKAPSVPSGTSTNHLFQSPTELGVAPVSSPVYEEQILSLLIRFPELKQTSLQVKTEYFKSVENQEIFRTCLLSDSPDELRTRLDPALLPYFERIANVSVINDNRQAVRLARCALRLEKHHYKTILKQIEIIQKAEEAQGMTGESLKLSEQAMAIAKQLHEIEKEDASRQTSGR